MYHAARCGSGTNKTVAAEAQCCRERPECPGPRHVDVPWHGLTSMSGIIGRQAKQVGRQVGTASLVLQLGVGNEETDAFRKARRLPGPAAAMKFFRRRNRVGWAASGRGNTLGRLSEHAELHRAPVMLRSHHREAAQSYSRVALWRRRQPFPGAAPDCWKTPRPP